MIRTLGEFEAAYRKGLGVPLPPRPWRTVSEEWLQRFGDGVGDHNPLFRDPGYAEQARYGTLVASPAFLFSIEFGANAAIWGHIPEEEVATKDLTLLYLGSEIEWHRPIWLGDRVRGVETPVEIRRTSMPQLGEACVCVGRTEYWNSRQELIATMRTNMLRFPNPGRGVESAPVTGAERRIAPDPLVWERRRRGGAPLFWEDVKEGEPVPDLPKGTYTTTELYLFAHAVLSTRRSRHVDEGTIDMGAGGRADPEYARSNRAQAASFDYGPQRICWLIQAVTDWMGDHGTLLRLDSRLRRPNLVGDTNTVRGSVARVHRDGDDLLAEIDVENVNQAGTVTANGRATVRLPAQGTDLAPPFPRTGEHRPGMYG
ncbi:FAS1-like dehydratase domain-containing protein [Actinomadura kijaniata]|uniref:FAS1-like dehydratase domain-containing protein n=1 Tax=Actinomadura kijaniata TaxID=46161 RepID=UPI0008363D50|nr:MaoC family dehydratase N-terminal domain-containing protein [Actinomadura kijaniata]